MEKISLFQVKISEISKYKENQHISTKTCWNISFNNYIVWRSRI